MKTKKTQMESSKGSKEKTQAQAKGKGEGLKKIQRDIDCESKN
jgi:hypothetical protein